MYIDVGIFVWGSDFSSMCKILISSNYDFHSKKMV